MADPPPTAGTPVDDPLDEFSEKLAAFNMLRKSDEAAANAILEQLGGSRGPVERDIVVQLAVPRPLHRPADFEAAHRRVVRAIEVLHRNGHRGVRFKAPGPLRPVAEFVQQLTTRFLVRSFLNDVINRLHGLYLAREGQCLPGTAEVVMLRRARVHTGRMAQTFRGNALGLPTFLLGGAVVSSALAALRGLVDRVTSDDLFLAAASAVVVAVFVGLAWVILRAAGVARRRIRMTLDQPLATLYRAIGAAGEPPQDQARTFALVAVFGLAVVWLVVPAALLAVLAR